MRHAEDPGARVLNLFPFAQCDIQTQKDFLRGFLCLRRIETQGEQIPVNVVPRFFEQPGDLVLQRRYRFVPGVSSPRIVRRTRMTTFPLQPKTSGKVISTTRVAKKIFEAVAFSVVGLTVGRVFGLNNVQSHAGTDRMHFHRHFQQQPVHPALL